MGKHKAQYIMQHAPVFQLSQSLQHLSSQAKNTPEVLQPLEQFCSTVLQQTPLLPFSALYVDVNGKLIAAYFGCHLTSVSSTFDCGLFTHIL